jgi:hypothetical protein
LFVGGNPRIAYVHEPLQRLTTFMH